MPELERVAVIIGAMKCGTTSLFNYLSEHGEVCRSASKEPMYFSRDTWQGGLDHYRRLWPDFDPDRHEVALEASTEYTKQPDFPNVARRIKSFSEHHGLRFKFLYIVRHPLQMVSSGLIHGQDDRWSKGDRDELLRHLVRVADFDAQLSAYRECFSPDAIHVMQLEKLDLDKAGQLETVAQFLGLNQGFNITGEATRYGTKDARRQGLSRIPAVEKLSEVKPLNSLWRSMPERARNTLRPAIGGLVGSLAPGSRRYPVKAWRLTSEERARIMKKLRPGLHKLASEYHLDLSLWNI